MNKKKTKLELESVTRDKIASFFRSSGYVVQTEVRNPCGRVDCLVKEYKPSGEIIHHVIECKRENSSYHLKAAIGQLNQYKKHYGDNTKLYFCTSDRNQLSKESRKIMSLNPDILYKVF